MIAPKADRRHKAGGSDLDAGASRSVPSLAPTLAWVKVRVGLLNDPAVMRLSDRAFRRYVELNLLASDQEPRDGRLPAASDISWRLRVLPKPLQADFTALERAGLLLRAGDDLSLPRFEAEQAAIPDAERQRAHRERVTDRYAAGHEPVTVRDQSRGEEIQSRKEADNSRQDVTGRDREEADNRQVAAAAVAADPVLLSDLHAYGISEGKAVSLLQKHGRGKVAAAIGSVSEAVAERRATNPAGLLVSILEQV